MRVYPGTDLAPTRSSVPAGKDGPEDGCVVSVGSGPSGHPCASAPAHPESRAGFASGRCLLGCDVAVAWVLSEVALRGVPGEQNQCPHGCSGIAPAAMGS